MFPRDRRVRSSQDILKALKAGRRAKAGPVTCSYFAKPGTLSRVTVIVSKKFAKLAVDRNRMKRQARAILYGYRLVPGDLVVQLAAGAREQPYQDLTEQLQQCLQRLF